MTAITLDTIRAGALRENGYPNFGAGGSGDLGQHTTITGHLTRETRPGYRQALPADSHLLEGRANHLIRAPNYGTDFRCIKVRHGQAEYRRYLSRFQGSHSDAGGRQIMNQAPNRGVLVHGDQPVFVHVAAGFDSALEKAIHVRVLCHEPLALMQLNILNTISRGFSVSPLDETLRVTFGSNPWRSTKPVRIAPRAVEQPKPARPVEIVRFLRPADLQVVS